MADVPIVVDATLPLGVWVASPTTVTVYATGGPTEMPILPPAGTYAAGGPTRGQLLPVGTR